MGDINNHIDKHRQTIKEIDEQIAKLNRVKQDIKTEIHNITKGKIHCGHCDNYFSNSDATYKEETRTIRECVYTDCGYGDDDLYADVKYKILYYICPYCGNDTEKSKQYISEGPSFDRWGNKV